MGFFKKKAEPPFVTAIIAAAGVSARMEGIDKQYAMLDDMPIVAHSIGSFCDCPLISEIVIVSRADQIADFYDLIRFYEFSKVSCVVAGGERRQESVFAGIRAANEKAAFYAVHDGARPFILPETIEKCVDTAFLTNAAAVGVPVKDTIKIVDERGVILSTPDRQTLWTVQTPQIFNAGLYRQAMELAINEGRDYTDDCQLIEAVGAPVTMVSGSYENIKITTPEDLAMAMSILEYREGGLDLWWDE